MRRDRPLFDRPLFERPLFDRWVARAYPRAFPGAPPLTPAAIDRAWGRGLRGVAGRLALACVDEGLVAGELAGDALTLRPGGGSPALVLPLVASAGLTRPQVLLEGREGREGPPPGEPALGDPLALLRVLRRSLVGGLANDPTHNKPALDRLAEELVDSAFNLALAELTAALREQTLARGLRWPAPLDPENLVVAGHPWHPMCKTRLGLSLAEVLACAPEHRAVAVIDAVDVEAGRVLCAGAWGSFAEENLFPRPDRGWVRLPVHRAQRRRLPRLFPELWGSAIRPAPVAPRVGRALLSLRTVAVARADERAAVHLKFSLAVVTTSARRTVSPMSVHNGPPLTALLAAIQADDPAAGRPTLMIQGDRAAAGLDPEIPRAAHLGVIVREAPEALARVLTGSPRAEAWVCAALGERRPGASGSLLCELAAASGGAEPLLRRYLDLLLRPALHLLSAYGIALELHLQNTLVVVDDRGLAGFIVRDLGGIRVHRGRLAGAGRNFEAAPGSFIVTDDLEETRDKLRHTLIHAHLGTLIAWAERDLGVAPARAWAWVRRIVRDHGAADDRAPRAAALDDREALLRPRCRSKALLRMRIDARSSDYLYREIANVLADPAVIAGAGG